WNAKLVRGISQSAETDKKIPIANSKFIGPRLPPKSLSEPQPATNEPTKPPISNIDRAALALIRL
ncbi:hypothetical protein D039_2795B, partial [Vibrio parahaemolyticus EKP-028]